MVAHTILLDFTVSSNQILDVDKRANLKANITNVLKEHFVDVKYLTETNIDGSLLILYTGPKGSLITVRGYIQGLVTLNVEYFKQYDEDTLLPFKVGNIHFLIHKINAFLYKLRNLYVYFFKIIFLKYL